MNMRKMRAEIEEAGIMTMIKNSVILWVECSDNSREVIR